MSCKADKSTRLLYTHYCLQSGQIVKVDQLVEILMLVAALYTGISMNCTILDQIRNAK